MTGTPATPEEWVALFKQIESVWMMDQHWLPPPYLLSDMFTELDAGSFDIEATNGLIFMMGVNHLIQNRRTVKTKHVQNTRWDEINPFYLEVMMMYNTPFFRDHITCGTSMRHPFPDFDERQPLHINNRLVDINGESFEIVITSNKEYEVLLNGIVLYTDQWIDGVGLDTVRELFSSVLRRGPLGNMLNGYREEERAAEMKKYGYTHMEADGTCE